MGFGATREEAFVGSLFGHTTTFLVSSRKANLKLARCFLSVLARNAIPCAILDIDALYSSGSNYIFAPLSDEDARKAEMLVPGPGSALESEFADLLGLGQARVLIVDSLNSLYHLLHAEGRGLRNMNLAFAVAMLSQIARTENKAVFMTMYQRERVARMGRGKPISELSDITVSTTLKGGVLVLSLERGSAWPVRDLLVPIP